MHSSFPILCAEKILEPESDAGKLMTAGLSQEDDIGGVSRQKCY